MKLLASLICYKRSARTAQSHLYTMDRYMQDLSRCNDIVNAVSNNCKRLAKCVDGSVVLTTHESKDMNSDVNVCRKILEEEAVHGEDQTVPRALNGNFEKDLLAGVFDKCGPWAVKSNERAEIAMCRAVLPGLNTIRKKLWQMARENCDDTLNSEEISIFFDHYVCTNELCLRGAFRGNDIDTLPCLNVSHPEWFYFPDDSGYFNNAVSYIKLFLASPCSKRCFLCDTFFRLTEQQDAVDLYGLPEQFRLNDIICSMYGRYEVNGRLCKLKISPSGKTDFIATWDNKVYY